MMRTTPSTRTIAAAAVAWMAFAVTVVQGQPKPEVGAPPAPVTYELTEVSPSVIVAQHDYGSNITCIALDDGLVFVDTSLSTSVARRFREAMEKHFGLPTKALILTHAHIDHILGMGAFADVPVVAAEGKKAFFERLATVEWTEERITAFAAIFPTFRKVVGDARPFVPTTFFADETTIGPAERGIVIKRTGGHSLDSSCVYFAAERVLVAGDLVQAHRRPYFGEPDTDIAAWIAALKAWHGMAVDKICPGHGPVVDREYLRGIWVYFEALETAVAKLKGEGMSITQIATHASLPAGYWEGGEADPLPVWWRSCIAVVYGSV